MKTNMMNLLSLAAFGASIIALFEMGVAVAQDDCPDGFFLFELELVTDEVPEDTSYEIYKVPDVLLDGSWLWLGSPISWCQYCLPNHDDFLVAAGSGFDAPNTLYKRSHCLPFGGGYEFVIYDASDDGLCCDSGPGFYTTFVNGEIDHFGDVFSSFEKSLFVVGRDDTTPSPPISWPIPVAPTAPAPPACSAFGNSCSANSDCCNNKCRGKNGAKTCKRG